MYVCIYEWLFPFAIFFISDFSKTAEPVSIEKTVDAHVRKLEGPKLNIRRRRGEDILGRVCNVHPSKSKCFYFWMLLHHVRYPSSFDYLKPVDGDFKGAYQAVTEVY